MSAVSIYNSERNKKSIYQVYEQFKQFIPPELRDKKDYQYDENETRIIIPMPRDTENYKLMVEICRQKALFFHEFEFTEYTRAEEKNAQYFQMFISCALESEGKSASDYGTKYTDCCNTCNVYGKLDGDVLVDRKFVKKYSIASLKPDIFVSKPVKWLIESSGLTGVKFEHMVKDFKGREIPEYYVMTFENRMPPMDSRTWFDYKFARKCKDCGFEIPYLRSRCYYKESDFGNVKDFNLSQEIYNNFNEPAIIVSKRVKEVFKEAKIRASFGMLNIMED